MGGSRVSLTYPRGQLLHANSEYNKAKLLPTTLDEYNQVLDRILPEKPVKLLPRESRDMWIDWRIG